MIKQPTPFQLASNIAFVTAKKVPTQVVPKVLPKTGSDIVRDDKLNPDTVKLFQGNADDIIWDKPDKNKTGNFVENLGSGIGQSIASFGNLGKKAGMYVGNEARALFGKERLTPEQLERAGGENNIANRITNWQTPQQKESVAGTIGNIAGVVGQSLVMPTGVGALSKIPAVAKLSAKAPVISSMVKGGIQGAVGQEQYNLATEGRLSSKEELGLSAGIGAGLPVVGNALSRVPAVRNAFSNYLKEGAKTNVSQALAPTTKKYKQLTEKITDDFLNKGLRGSKESLLKIANEGVEKFGAKIDEAIESGALDNVTISTKPLKELVQEAKKSTMVLGNVVNKSKHAVLDAMEEMLTPFQNTIGGKEARRFKQILDEIVYSTKGGIGVEDMTYKNIISKGLADSLRSQLSKASPDLANLNKEFSFYKKLEEVLEATTQRQRPQQGAVRKFIAGAFAGTQDGIVNKIISYVGGKLFLDATSGATRKTLSALSKNKLANAIATGSPKIINTTVRELNEQHNLSLPYYNEGPPLPKSTPPQIKEQVPKTNGTKPKLPKGEVLEQDLYHATPSENVQSILKEGLKPSEKGAMGKAVYFTKDINKSKQYVSSMKSKGSDIIKASLLPDAKIYKYYPSKSYYEQDAIGKKILDLEKKSGMRDILLKEGYDGVEMENGSIGIYNEAKIKIKPLLGKPKVPGK